MMTFIDGVTDLLAVAMVWESCRYLKKHADPRARMFYEWLGSPRKQFHFFTGFGRCLLRHSLCTVPGLMLMGCCMVLFLPDMKPHHIPSIESIKSALKGMYQLAWLIAVFNIYFDTIRTLIHHNPQWLSPPKP